MDDTDVPCIVLRVREQKHFEKGHPTPGEIVTCDYDRGTVEDDNDHVTVEEEAPESEAVQETGREFKAGCTVKSEGYRLIEEGYSRQTDSEDDLDEVYKIRDFGITDMRESTIILESVTWNGNYTTVEKLGSGFSSYISWRDRKSKVNVYNKLRARSFYQLPYSGHQPALVDQQVQVPAVFPVPSDEYCRLFFQLAILFDCLNVVPAISREMCFIEWESTSGVTTIRRCFSEILSARFSQREFTLGVSRSGYGFLLPYDDPGQLLHRQRALTFHREFSDPPGHNIEESEEFIENYDQNNTIHSPANFTESDFSPDCFTEKKVKDGSCLHRGQQLTIPGHYLGKIYRHYAILNKVVSVACRDQNVELELIHFTKKGGKREIFKTNEKYDLDTADLRIVVCQNQRYLPDEIAQRAESMLHGVAGGKFKKYSVFRNNCEHFTMWCAVGIKQSFQVQNMWWVLIENIFMFVVSVVFISFLDRAMLGITNWIPVLLVFFVCFIYYLYKTVNLCRQLFSGLSHSRMTLIQFLLEFLSWTVACIALSRILSLSHSSTLLLHLQ